jgi:hypothetical protein
MSAEAPPQNQTPSHQQWLRWIGCLFQQARRRRYPLLSSHRSAASPVAL